jgi:hypothetical protein
MVTLNEISRIAIVLGVDPPVVDHDYVLGCLLYYLSLQPEVQGSLLFKGGKSATSPNTVSPKTSISRH